jgi:hypothetical protein
LLTRLLIRLIACESIVQERIGAGYRQSISLAVLPGSSTVEKELNPWPRRALPS